MPFFCSELRLISHRWLTRLGGAVVIAGVCSLWPLGMAAETATTTATNSIQIAKLTRTNIVDFAKEVLPIFRKSCLPCHNASDAKGSLVMENPVALLKGGETGPAVVPGKGHESLMLKLAARLEKPFMPPKNNKADAQPLTPDELGLMQLWINQGATGAVSNILPPIVWQPLPKELASINAVTITADGRFAACNRGNQVHVYDIPTAQFLTRLADPELAKSGLYKDMEVADRDVIESLAFSPDGQLLASGGFRSIKLWRKKLNDPLPLLTTNATTSGRLLAISLDGRWAASVTTNHHIQLHDAQSGLVVRTLNGHTGEVRQVKFSPNSTLLASLAQDNTLRVWNFSNINALVTNQVSSDSRVLTWLGGNQQIATAGKAIEIWSASPSTNTLPLQKIAGHTKPITAIAGTSGENPQLVSGDEEGIIKLWDAKKTEPRREWKLGSSVTAIAIHSEQHRVAAASAQSFKLFDTEKAEPIAEPKGDLTLTAQASQQDRDLIFAKAEVDFQKTTVNSGDKSQKAEAEALKKVTEIKDKTTKASAEKKEATDKASTVRSNVENQLKTTQSFLKVANDNKSLADKLNEAAKADLNRANDRQGQAKELLARAQEKRDAAYKSVQEAAVAKAADTETTIDRATIAKNALDANHSLKAIADKEVSEAKERLKIAADNLIAAGNAATPISSQIADNENKLKSAEKTLAEATEAQKKADDATQLADRNLQSTTTVSKNAEETLVRNKTNLVTAEAKQKDQESKSTAARDRSNKATHPPRSLAFLSGGHLLAVGTEDGLILTFSATTGDPVEIRTVPINGPKPTPVMEISPLGEDRIAVIRAGQSTLSLGFDNQWVLERTLGTGDDQSSIVDRVLTVAFSHDGTKLASGGGAPSRSGEIKLWQVADGKLLRDFKDPHSDTVYTLRFSYDDQFLASGGADKFGRTFDVATGKQIKSFEGHTHHVLGIAWKRDGRSLATSGADKVVKVWDVPSGEQRKTISDFGKEVTSIQFLDASNEFIASSGDQKIRQVRDNGENVRTMEAEGDFVQSAAVTPDGRYLVAGGQNGTLRLFDAPKAKLLHSFTAPKHESPKVAAK